MNKKLLLPLVLLSLVLLFSACTESTTANKGANQTTRNVVENKSDKISDSEITDAKKVIEEYFKAIKDCDLDKIHSVLGKYKKGTWNKDNVEKCKPELIKIEYPGKHLVNLMPPSSYKSNYGKDPFECICLNVVFKDSDGEKDWDYILIKETKYTPWVIHDWGV